MKLKIENPCTESWDKMGKGTFSRHCFSCSKEVIDFTSMDKENIVKYFSENLGKKTCGRFLKS